MDCFGIRPFEDKDCERKVVNLLDVSMVGVSLYLFISETYVVRVLWLLIVI